MDVLLNIGEFSKMTYLSVKALRHYHDVGLLEPAAVDAATGYRQYSIAQVSTAQAIRRFRDLDMPIEQIRTVLDAPDLQARNDAILAHLQRMQEELSRTQETVASLQALLVPAPDGDVQLRSFPAASALAITELVSFDACAEWLEAAYAELHAALDAAAIEPADVDGALYPDELFELGAGRVVAFVPVAAPADLPQAGRVAALDLAAGDYAVMVHTGPFGDIDRTYGALGAVVARRGIAAAGPIRERYPEDGVAEVCWPVVAPVNNH